MRNVIWMAVLLVLVGGCTTNKLAARKQQKAEAYAALSPETKAAVDQGQIKIGMPMDAVYIAWGKPSQVLSGESPTGSTTTWLYTDWSLQPYSYWRYHPWAFYGYWGSPMPYLDYDYVPRAYTSAEVVFENGVVKSWRTLRRPYG